jgi:hypothetical protein
LAESFQVALDVLKFPDQFIVFDEWRTNSQGWKRDKFSIIVDPGHQQGWRMSPTNDLLKTQVLGITSTDDPDFISELVDKGEDTLRQIVDRPRRLVDGAAAGRLGGVPAAASVGWWFGFGYFLAGLYWVGHAFLVDAKTFGWLLPFAVIALPAGMALYTALGLALARLIWTRGAARVLALAISLTLAEWLRGHLFSGFPWNVYGYALISPLWLAQGAALIGIWGLTFLAVAIYASPAVLADDRSETKRPWLAPARPKRSTPRSASRSPRQPPRRSVPQPPSPLAFLIFSASAAGAEASPFLSFSSIVFNSSASGLRSRACDHWNLASSMRSTFQ